MLLKNQLLFKFSNVSTGSFPFLLLYIIALTIQVCRKENPRLFIEKKNFKANYKYQTRHLQSKPLHMQIYCNQ